MSENKNGILKTSIKRLAEAKIGLAKKLAYDSIDMFDEVNFIDDGMINIKIGRLKKEFKVITDEIKQISKFEDINSVSTNEKVKELVRKQKEIQFHMVFLASNNYDNIDNCLKLVEGLNNEFKYCLFGLNEYRNGNEQEAFNMFYNYFKDKNGLIEHHLINKVYGKILFKAKQYKQSQYSGSVVKTQILKR